MVRILFPQCPIAVLLVEQAVLAFLADPQEDDLRALGPCTAAAAGAAPFSSAPARIAAAPAARGNPIVVSLSWCEDSEIRDIPYREFPNLNHTRLDGLVARFTCNSPQRIARSGH